MFLTAGTRILKPSLLQKDPLVLVNRFEPPCECSVCLQQYRSMAGQLDFNIRYTYHGRYSDSDAGKLCRELAKETENTRIDLQQRCLTHGDEILRRWLAKPRAEREAMILAELPSIYPLYFPEPRLVYEARNTDL